MQAECKSGILKGAIKIPASKSMMQRVCAAALLNKGRTVILNPGVSADDKAALSLVEQLGARVSHREDKVVIVSKGLAPNTGTLHCSESGLSARLFIPIAALCTQPLQVTGSGSLLKRPFDAYVQALPQLDVQLTSNNALLPITVHGPLKAKDIILDGSLSSQFLSGLLFAYAFSATKPCTITVNNLQSRPYIDMTLSVLELFGRPVMNTGYESFHIDPAKFTINADNEITIEGDWSSATALLVGAAISGDVTVDGVYEYSLQADKAIMTVLYETGALLSLAETWVEVTSPDSLKPFVFDATHSPDMFPLLSVLAACCAGKSEIKGVHRLVHKESNRMVSISVMLTQLGVQHTVAEDSLFIEGRQTLNSCTINSYNDHRIVMAAAIAALRCDGKIVVENAEAVNKSYPDFFAHLYALGAEGELKD